MTYSRHTGVPAASPSSALRTRRLWLVTNARACRILTKYIEPYDAKRAMRTPGETCRMRQFAKLARVGGEAPWIIAGSRQGDKIGHRRTRL